MRFAHLIWSCLIFLAATGVALAEPTRSQIQSRIVQALPNTVQIERMNYRVFPGQTGTGRVSVEGTALLVHETFREDRAAWLAEAISRGDGVWQTDGTENQDAARVERRHIEDAFRDLERARRVRFFVSAQAARSVSIRFNYELHYTETVGGVRLTIQDGGYNVRAIQGATRGVVSSAGGIVPGSAEAEQFFASLRLLAAQKASAEDAGRVALERQRDDFLDLMSNVNIYLSRAQRRRTFPWDFRYHMAIGNCIRGDERERETRNQFGHITNRSYEVRMDCEGRSNDFREHGQFRFVDGLEIYHEQTRPVRVWLVFDDESRFASNITDRSADSTRQWGEPWINICVQKIEEDVGRGGPAAGRWTLGQYVCPQRSDVMQFRDNRRGFTTRRGGRSLVPIEVAREEFGLPANTTQQFGLQIRDSAQRDGQTGTASDDDGGSVGGTALFACEAAAGPERPFEDLRAGGTVRAIALCRAAIAANPEHSGAMAFLGRAHHAAHAYAEAIQWYGAAAAAGDTMAMNNLGMIIVFGPEEHRDYAEGRLLFTIASEHGNAQAMNNLGSLFWHGLGVAQDHGRAFRIFMQACESGEMQGCANVASAYDSGLGVARNALQARSYWRRACNGGLRAACR